MTPVITAGARDLGILAALIADAFCDLPPSRWLISDPDARRRLLPGYFRLYLDHALTAGVICTTADRDAAALWIPAGHQPPAPPPDYPDRLAAATGPWTRQFVLFDAALERAHPVGVPHHHLAILAVRPGRQGHGTGTALLSACHHTLDQAAIPAYLEASSPRNRSLYLRHGYQDHGPPIRLPGGPPMYPMWRQPAPLMNPHQERQSVQ